MTTRILSYIPGATFGGAHNQALRLGEALRPHGYKVVVLLPEEPGDARERLECSGLEVHTAPLRRLRATRAMRTHWKLVREGPKQVSILRRLIRDLDADIVQIHGITCLDGAMAARHEQKPLIWQLIDCRAPLALRCVLVPYVWRSKATVMTTGTVIQRAFPGLSHIGAERLVPFYPPVDGKEFDGDEGRRRKARSILGVPADVPLVVCLANLNPQKGIEGLLGACAKAISDGARLAVRVRGSESPAHAGYRERLEALAVDLGLGGNCVGSLESELTPADFLSGGDIFAIASCARSEGVPTALLEAMSSRLPIVATRVGGISEIVSDECGVTVPPGDGAALAAALQSAVEWPRSRRLALGGAGRTFVETHASTAACVDAHVSAYSRVLGIRGASTASGSRSLASNVRTLSNPENIDRR